MKAAILRAIALHRHTLGPTSASDGSVLRAADRDGTEFGGVFALASGGGHGYSRWFMRLGGRRFQCHMTKATGSDEWWCDGLDRHHAELLAELGIVGRTFDWLPQEAPERSSYGRLTRKLLASPAEIQNAAWRRWAMGPGALRKA